MKQKYVIESFASVSSFVNTINSKTRMAGASNSSHSHGRDFTGTESYEEANELALYGDKKSAEKINSSIKKQKLNSNNELRAQPKILRSVAGSRPCVAAAILGMPNSMYRRQKVYVKKPVCTIYYSMSTSGGVEHEELIDAGARLAEAVQTIERSGVRVNLYVGNTSCEGSETTCVFVKVKDSLKDFNLLRMSYALVNPSFFRRHWFHWVEVCEKINTRNWAGGYGRPLYGDREENEVRKAMKDNGVKFDSLVTFYNIQNKKVDEIVNLITGGDK